MLGSGIICFLAGVIGVRLVNLLWLLSGRGFDSHHLHQLFDFLGNLKINLIFVLTFPIGYGIL